MAADADRLPPGEALEDNLVGVDLQADLDEAREPAFEVPLVPAPGANELSPGKSKLTSSAYSATVGPVSPARIESMLRAIILPASQENIGGLLRWLVSDQARAARR